METAFLKELLWVKSIEKLRYFNFSSVVKYVDADGSQRLITEGYNLFLNNFYHDIWCASKENNTFLKACCFPRQRKNDPARLLYFQGHEEGEEFKVDISYCSCKAG